MKSIGEIVATPAKRTPTVIHVLSRAGRSIGLLSFVACLAIPERTEALIGGRGGDAIQAEFSSTVLFSGIMPCTAVIVGSQAALTAGHCVDDQGQDDNGQGSIQFGPSGAVVSVLCTNYRQFTGVYDIAVCKPASLSDTFSNSGMKFEVIQTDPSQISADTQATLAGYGCTALNMPAPDYGTLLAGTTGIESTSSNPATPDPTNLKKDILTTVGGAILCEGDSGGAAFDQENPSARFVIGIGMVRSKIDPTESYFVQVSDDRIKSWLQSWGDSRGIAICGVHSNATGCR